jgi:hypothetical protein
MRDPVNCSLHMRLGLPAKAQPVRRVIGHEIAYATEGCIPLRAKPPKVRLRDPTDAQVLVKRGW